MPRIAPPSTPANAGTAVTMPCLAPETAASTASVITSRSTQFTPHLRVRRRFRTGTWNSGPAFLRTPPAEVLGGTPGYVKLTYVGGVPWPLPAGEGQQLGEQPRREAPAQHPRKGERGTGVAAGV